MSTSMPMWARVIMLTVPAVFLGCGSPSLTNTNWSCGSDADCGSGQVCGTVAGARACVATASTPLVIGMSGPLQGPSQDLGLEMRRGVSAMFGRANAEGGVFGRPIELRSMNDNYDPMLAVQNMKVLLDIQQESGSPDVPDVRGGNSVFAILGNIGTPTMLETAPIATRDRVLFFAPFTGAQKYLRDGTNSPYVYNYRAGYYQEADAMVDYMATYRQPRVITNPASSYRHILAFTQRDSYGDAGYSGLVNSYNRLAPLPQPDSTQPNPSIRRLYYDREDVRSVEPAIAEAASVLTAMLAEEPGTLSIAFVMVDTYQPGNKFIRGVLDWVNQDAARAGRLDLVFMHVSFVGSDALAAALVSPPETYLDIRDGKTRRSYADGVIVTQVVPYYGSQAVGVRDYRADIDRFDGGSYSFTSLEGYIAARLFVQSLLLNGPSIDTESARATLDMRVMNLDIGMGTLLGFSSTNHQASDTVWGSVIQADGTFKVPFMWNPRQRIVPN